MFRIGKLTDYAMLIMSQLAREPDSILSASYLAGVLNLTSPTVSKILKMLADANLVNSTRGHEGGYYLARPAADISLTDILTAMEGEFALMECCESLSLCALESMCTMRKNWMKINKTIRSLLDQLTIIDMLKPLSPAKIMLGEVAVKGPFNGK